MLIHTIIQSANHVEVVKYIKSCRYSSTASMFTSDNRLEKNLISVTLTVANQSFLNSYLSIAADPMHNLPSSTGYFRQHNGKSQNKSELILLQWQQEIGSINVQLTNQRK